jgi:hypothetical protein
MCHQSGGLILNAIERVGISTIGITLKPEISLAVRPPRSVYVRFPLGNPFGEPFRIDQQMKVLKATLLALKTLPEPGLVWELPYRWRRF